jgi:cytoplasmic tRNA 2-thiolation protein 1
MPPKVCDRCRTKRAALKRPKTAESVCKECFFHAFETEVHETIVGARMFEKGERVAIAASGGKGGTGTPVFSLFRWDL